ncbi:MAG TPA: amidohydrolase family protein [Longimicrobiaceae bacterium]|nr:amidohydrolase family protein [Longimicrobiaceae bacterium]
MSPWATGLLTSLVWFAACARPDASGQERLEGDQLLVLEGATLIDGTGAAPRPGATVVVQNGRILRVGARGEFRYPADARVLDLAGRYLVPGFIDTHAHVAILRWKQQADGTLQGTYSREVSERVLRALLALGVTTVRNPGAPTAEEGVRLRDAVASGAVLGPRILTAGSVLVVPPGPRAEAAVREEVRQQAEAGVDMIKLSPGLPPVLVKAAIEEAHARDLTVVGHLQRTTWTEAARLGIDAITHGSPWAPEYLAAHRRGAYQQTMRGRLDWLEWVDLQGPEITEMIDALVRHRVPVDPTLIAYHTKFWGDDPRHLENPERFLIPEILEDWNAVGGFTNDWTPEDYRRGKRLWPKVLQLVKLYHERGVLLAAGSDLPNAWVVPGVSFHQELQLLADAGIPASEVLRIATRNGARTLGIDGEVGTIEAGKVADLLVLGADPTASLAHTRRIECVLRAGALYSPRALLDSIGATQVRAQSCPFTAEPRAQPGGEPE